MNEALPREPSEDEIMHDFDLLIGEVREMEYKMHTFQDRMKVLQFHVNRRQRRKSIGIPMLPLGFVPQQQNRNPHLALPRASADKSSQLLARRSPLRTCSLRTIHSISVPQDPPIDSPVSAPAPTVTSTPVPVPVPVPVSYVPVASVTPVISASLVSITPPRAWYHTILCCCSR